MATDITTRSALQSASARPSIDTTLTRSEVMNSKKLGCDESMGKDWDSLPETLGGDGRRRREACFGRGFLLQELVNERRDLQILVSEGLGKREELGRILGFGIGGNGWRER